MADVMSTKYKMPSVCRGSNRGPKNGDDAYYSVPCLPMYTIAIHTRSHLD